MLTDVIADRSQAEFVIVGAGPAGLVLAAALAGAGRTVTLLESGGLSPDPDAQLLNTGVVTGVPYAGLTATRHRQVGGTARIWNTPVAGAAGAKYVPLHPRDCASWPVAFTDLIPWYEQAQMACGLGPFAYDGTTWAAPGRPCPADPAGFFETGVYQFGTLQQLLDRPLARVAQDSGVTLCHGVTVAGLVTDPNRRRIASVTALRRDGSPVSVSANVVILACGAIENARLLLAHRGGLSAIDQGDWLGRCFMEHPRDFSMSLALRHPHELERLRFFDQHRAGDGTTVAGRLALTTDAMTGARLPAAAITLLPVPRPTPTLLQRLLRRRAPLPAGGYGWSERSGPCDHCRLVLNLEQAPTRENRILLDQGVDPTGLPRVRLDWRWTDPEQERLDRLRREVARWFEDSGWGKVSFAAGRPPDFNAHHHAGTTRMDPDPAGGVVDADLRVHGTENLYLTGASVFPSSGWANPTLTIVALSLRLADYLRGTA